MNGHPALPAQTLPISQFWLIAALKPTAAVSNNVPISPPRLAVQISSSNALALLKEIGATHLMDLLHPLDRKKAEKTLFQTYCGKSFERTFSLDGRCLTR